MLAYMSRSDTLQRAKILVPVILLVLVAALVASVVTAAPRKPPALLGASAGVTGTGTHQRRSAGGDRRRDAHDRLCRARRPACGGASPGTRARGARQRWKRAAWRMIPLNTSCQVSEQGRGRRSGLLPGPRTSPKVKASTPRSCSTFRTGPSIWHWNCRAGRDCLWGAAHHRGRG